MVRFVTFVIEFAADSVMSAEISGIAQELSVNGRYHVDIVSAGVLPANSEGPAIVLVLFEVTDDDDDGASANGTH
jgi:hypothetical protein